MKKRKILIGVIIIIGLIAVIYFAFLKQEKSEYSLVKVARGDVTQEVAETGKVKMGEEINLSFKNSGRIEEVYVKVGDEVDAGQSLAKLDTMQLSIQLTEAQANLEVVRAQKRDAQISLESARQELEDTMATASEKIEKSYADALSVLDSSYLKMYNAFSFIDLLKETYFYRGDMESFTISEDKYRIEIALNLAKPYIDKAQTSSEKEDIDLVLIKTKKVLSDVKKALEEARNVVEILAYKDIISNTDRNFLDTHQANINTALSSIVSSQQNISLTQTSNQADINTAKSQVLNLESQLKEDEESLYQAQINQAKTQIDLLTNQIWEATLKSPTEGQITKISKRAGEMTQPTDYVISLISAAPFQVEVDIYEEDVVKIKTSNQVDINLTAFPEEVFTGKVVSIDPAEKLVEGIVYYEVAIDLEGLPSGIKPGMTADIVVKTASRKNVLIVPGGAIEKKDGKVTVQIVHGDELEVKEIETGLEGSDGMVEVISGLTQGEEVVMK